MKANNYLVTYTDLTTMGLTTKATPPTGNRIATKGFINSYYYIDQSYLIGYTNNQCVMYQDIQGGYYNSSTIYYVAYPDLYTGFDTRALACSHATGLSKSVYWFGALGVGTNLFYDEGGVNGYSFAGYYPNASSYGGPYFSMSGYSFQLGPSFYSGCSICGVQDISTCVTSYGWMFNGGGAGYSTSGAALAAFTGGPYRYSNINAMVSGVTRFYADSALAYPFNGNDLWYCVQLNGTGTRYAALINTTGVVTTYTT